MEVQHTNQPAFAGHRSQYLDQFVESAYGGRHFDMGDQAGSTHLPPASTDPSGSAGKRLNDIAFHTQFEDLSQSQGAPASRRYEQHPFDMRQMAGSLPPGIDTPYGDRQSSSQFDMPAPTGMLNPQSLQYSQQYAQYPPQRHDPNMLARLQQQQYLSQQMNHQFGQYHHGNRSQPVQLQTQQSYFRSDYPYGYAMNSASASPVDTRYQAQSYQSSYSVPSGHDMGQYPRRGSEPHAAIPAFPRGPPRKPKQSGHALWVGNLPPAAMVIDLKDHFSRDATKDIESLFLISKSNCAFVNYRSEAACVAAMNRFHDSRFHGVRLVCRLRRGSTSTSGAAAVPESPKVPEMDSQPQPDGLRAEDMDTPTIVGSSPAGISEQSGATSTRPVTQDANIPEKFFIVKSLTLQDLEASVRNGIWATQSHNESSLNRAFDEADNVYLIFSANKSGEYFGYARMGSSITGDFVQTGSTPAPPSPAQSSAPQSIPTAATETAPRGHIIDDSARGTIFWEAEVSDEEGRESPTKEGVDSTGGQDLGRPFKIEWVSTAHLPFYRTRGLRNPWNANREVKIARDGTELEPSVGKRLVQMFHRPAPPPDQTMMQQGGVPYRMG